MLLQIGTMLVMFSLTAAAHGRRKRNIEEVAEMAKYFSQYSQLHDAMDGVVRTGYSSADGRHRVEFDRSPAFVERILEMESQTGLSETGRISKELLREAKKPRCGVSDAPRESDEVGAYVVKSMWDSKYNAEKRIYPLSFSIVDTGKLPSYMKWGDIEEGLLSAMCLWESNSNIRFKDIGTNKFEADLTFRFARGQHGDWYSFDGSGGTLAHAFYPESGRLHFDLEESWYLSRKGAVDLRKKDLFTVAAHELGHSIGLMHSESRGALMAPIYKYAGTLQEYKLPQDDIDGVVNIYGSRIEAQPAEEPGTACYNLKVIYGVSSDNLVSDSVPKRPRRRKRGCRDDSRYRRYCPRWLSAGFCDHPQHGKTLRRRCKKTCGFCPVKPLPRRPRKNEDASSISHSVCGLTKFDSVTVSLDSGNFLNMLYFKDEYYFESSIVSDGEPAPMPNMLHSTEDIGSKIPWHTDPKSIKVGSFKLQNPDMFSMTKSVDAVALTKSRYIVFEKDTGIIHQYSLGTPTVLYLSNSTIQAMYESYPHYNVDAVYVEYNVGAERDTVHSLFQHDLMWQFKEVAPANISEEEESILQLEPIALKQGVPISQWHGVSACGIDSIFKYKGIPYFLKGTIFWTALDSEPMIPKDLSYNFLRCWEEEPLLGPDPPTCGATFGSQTAGEIEDGSTNTSAFTSYSMTALLLSWALASWTQLI